MHTRHLISLLAALALIGCEKPRGGSWRYPAAPASTTRPAEIPPDGVSTLATAADMAASAQWAADPAVKKAVADHLGSSAPRWQIGAARRVGDYVLLWIGFPDVMDGGIDLVYSIKEQRIGWHFQGGPLG